ncbi:uncharacterized protein TNCV_2744221 [Trichonephila clavipes]|nr:uncharacterized protein TNCV_2744221 [Trichonephila clavipes]
MASRRNFSTRQYSASHGKGLTRLFPHCYYPSSAYSIPGFVSNRAYLGLFGIVSWISNEFEATRGKVTANVEQNVSKHHTELNASMPNRIASCIRDRGGSTRY